MRYRLEVIAFVAGGSLMVIELVGSRVVSPLLGASIFVWTSLIGVVLACLSAGYWVGGRMADKRPTLSALSFVLLASALATFAILVFYPFAALFSLITTDLRLAATLVSTLLFAPVSFALGMISPYVARLAIIDKETAGGTVGRLYAISTGGSIVGTFLGGFILVSYVSTNTIVLGVGVVLAALFFFARIGQADKLKTTLGLLFCAGILATALFTLSSMRLDLLADIDTKYNRWIVGEGKYGGRDARMLLNNISGTQSAQYPDDPTELVFPYLMTFDLAERLHGALGRTLLLGAGAYTYPIHFLAKFPNASMDTVEIDDELDRIAADYFHLTPNDRLHIFEIDARKFFDEPRGPYDAIFVDTFSSALSIPVHLTTKEYFQTLAPALAKDGVLFVNTISAIDGDDAGFLRAFLATLRSVFPHVIILPAVPDVPPTKIQNVTLIASPSPLPHDVERYAPWRPHSVGDVDSTLVLTDQFAPVEKYTANFMSTFFAGARSR